MRVRHYWRHSVRDRLPRVLAGLVCDPRAAVDGLAREPRPPLSWLSRWIGFLTTPFKFLGISGWKETGCDARVVGVPVRPAQHSTDGFWTIDVELRLFQIGSVVAESPRYVRIEVEPGTFAHAVCSRHAVGPGTRLELSGPVVVDRDAGGFLEIHPDDDFRIVRGEEAEETPAEPSGLAAPAVSEQAELAGGLAAPKLPRRRVAFLVIHGIGEQKPYETIDSFARGLARHFQGLGHEPRLRPQRVSHGNWTEAAVHLEFAVPATPRGLTAVGVHEFYWAPYTEGKVTTRDVLFWLARTFLSPLRYLSDNLAALAMARDRRGRGAGSDAFIFLREIGRSAILYLPVIAGSALLIAAPFFISGMAFPKSSVSAAAALLRNRREAAELLGAFASLALVAALLLLLLRSFHEPARYESAPSQPDAVRTWRILAALFLIPLSAASWSLLRLLRGAPDAAALGRSFREGPAAPVLVGWVLALLVGRWVLLKFVGDIAVYVTADRRAKNYAARNAILTNGMEMLESLLVDAGGEYDEIFLAGHSLGSVVAFDLIDRALTSTWAGPDPSGRPTPGRLQARHLERLRGLVTFGSPLDKVFYFFREHVKQVQGIRMQILGFLYSFRRLPPDQDFGSLAFALDPPPPDGRAESALPALGHDFHWINVWSPGDPVSGCLRFYRISPWNQLRLFNHRYWIWGFGHLAYWHDDAFYGYVARKLL